MAHKTNDHSAILASAPSLESRIYGCWMGKSIGGTLGLPVEGKLGPLSLTFYDPVPTIAPPNDDLELQLVWLDLIEKSESGRLTADDFGRGWLRHIHYMWDEYGRCRWNLRRGVPATEAGAFENPFHAGMGSPIRSEIWACLFPDDPASAAYYAGLDASLDHGVEGIAGEVLFAFMQSRVAAGAPVEEAIREALRIIPASSETARAVEQVMDGHRRGVEMWESRKQLLQKHDNANFTHAPLNVALAIWALLYGEGDFGKSILLSTNAGYDTDSTAATVGATIGLAIGIDGIPARWKAPIGDGVYLGPGIKDLDDAPTTLKELTRRVAAAIGRLERKTIDEIPWHPAGTTKLETLPGTLRMRAHGEAKDFAWANGELSEAVKRAGGGQWEWPVNDGLPRNIVCLAANGARLFFNDSEILRCEAGLPYVTATHRCPEGSRVLMTPGPGVHRMRIELDSSDPRQEATVLLAYEDLHICPWTAEELPHRARL
ncbi:MAG: ADP-ribosylglycohydrolase family protein [Opitutaceae bacterium]